MKLQDGNKESDNVGMKIFLKSGLSSQNFLDFNKIP